MQPMFTSFPPRIMIAATGFLIIIIGYFYIIVYFGARKRNINEICPADFVYVSFAYEISPADFVYVAFA